MKHVSKLVRFMKERKNNIYIYIYIYISEIRSNHVAAGARHCFGLGVVEGGIPQHFWP